MKKALMIIAMVTIVAIAGSMIYYFVFFRPGLSREEFAFQKEKYATEQKEKQENKQALEKALKEENDRFSGSMLILTKAGMSGGGTSEEWTVIVKVHQDIIDNLYKQYGN